MSAIQADDGRQVGVARFKCTGEGCHAYYDVRLKSGENINPSAMVATMRNKGWTAHPLRPQDTFCPDCLAKKTPNDPDSELKKVATKMSAIPEAVRETVVPIAPLTTEQRVKIRHLLETHFDEGKGYYAEGWNDQAIAEHVAVPRVHVERMRESAYGPIRVTAQQQALMKEMAVLEARIENSERKFRQLFEQLDPLEREIAGQRQALDALRQKAQAA